VNDAHVSAQTFLEQRSKIMAGGHNLIPRHIHAGHCDDQAEKGGQYTHTNSVLVNPEGLGAMPFMPISTSSATIDPRNSTTLAAILIQHPILINSFSIIV
jgi:hypothetical protein